MDHLNVIDKYIFTFECEYDKLRIFDTCIHNKDRALPTWLRESYNDYYNGQNGDTIVFW